MLQTVKRYRKISGTEEYVEDPKGFNRVYFWTDEFNVQRRVIYTNIGNNLDNEFNIVESRFEHFDPLFQKWMFDHNVNTRATNDAYVYNDGTYEPEPFEEDGTTLKDGLIPMATYYDVLQDSLFKTVIETIQKAKFGATDFN